MGLFRATVKMNHYTNGQRLEKGMTVDFSSQLTGPLNTNGGHDVIDAFMRKYGVDIEKACARSSTYIEVVKIN